MQKQHNNESLSPEEDSAKGDAEYLVGWYDSTLEASAWLGLKSLPPPKAAALLSGHKPDDDDFNPVTDSTDETEPIDYKRLLRVFESEATDGQRRGLIDWLEVAKDNDLRVHYWIGAYLDAKTALKQSEPRAPKLNGPCVTKAELIDVLGLHENKWEEILRKPNTRGKRYLKALVQKGKQGRVAGGRTSPTLWNPVVFARLLIESGENDVKVKARFKRHWPKWIAELEAEMGEII